MSTRRLLLASQPAGGGSLITFTVNDVEYQAEKCMVRKVYNI